MTAQQVNLESNEFQPKNEYLLIKPAESMSEKTTDAGIIIPLMDKSAVTSRPTSGTVVAAGTDIVDIEIGDFVMWPSTDGLDLSFNDGEYILMRYKSIIGLKKR